MYSVMKHNKRKYCCFQSCWEEKQTHLVRRQTSWRTSSLMAAVPLRKLYSKSSRMRPCRTRICRRAGLVASARSRVMQCPVTAEAQP